MSDARPFTILIAALGGEGGGVLADLISQAAVLDGLAVGRTSIPGVAQRTGATSYYIEIFPIPLAELGGRRPVLALQPAPGRIDLLAATELLEAGRMMQSGFVSPERTTLVASTHRIFTVQEKSGAGDARYDGLKILDAARKFSRQAVLFDMDAAARGAGSIINVVLLGAMASSGRLPVSADSLARAIEESGKAVEANLRGFEAGLKGASEASAPAPARPRLRAVPVERLLARARDTFPEATLDFVCEGVTRLADYQDERYAATYLDRLDTIRALDGGDYALTRETARYLALWMAYQDLVRVAQQKSSRDRFARVRAEVQARPGEPVQIVEYFKPGIEEFCAVMPSFMARPILAWARRRGDNLNFAIHVHSSTVFGFLQLWLLTRLRGLRPYSHRFAEERERIEEWLGWLRAAASMGDRDLAVEIAKCAGVIKGYGDTFNRGLADYRLIAERAIQPALAGDLTDPAGTVRGARSAVLGDPDGETPGSRDFNFIPLASIR